MYDKLIKVINSLTEKEIINALKYFYSLGFYDGKIRIDEEFDNAVEEFLNREKI